MQPSVQPMPLPGVLIVESRVFTDDRGFFCEVFNARAFAGAGLPTEFVQDNHSRSVKGVVRGLHFQSDTAQGKLVRAVRGSIFDVAVDVRRGSPLFGHWTSATLGEGDGRAMWIPPGFAHGFCVLSDVADVVYKCTGLYDPADEQGILWDDPAIGIQWPLHEPLLSPRDRALPRLSEITRLPAFDQV